MMLSTKKKKKCLHKAYIHVRADNNPNCKMPNCTPPLFLLFKAVEMFYICTQRDRFMMARNKQHMESYSSTRQYATAILSLSKITVLYNFLWPRVLDRHIKVISPSLSAMTFFLNSYKLRYQIRKRLNRRQNAICQLIFKAAEVFSW